MNGVVRSDPGVMIGRLDAQRLANGTACITTWTSRLAEFRKWRGFHVFNDFSAELCVIDNTSGAAFPIVVF